MSLVQLLDEVLLLLGHRIAEKRIWLETRFQTDPATVTRDENRLTQVFLNLLMNSLEVVLDEGRIAVEIAKAHCGTHTDESTPGEWTSFDVHLPRTTVTGKSEG